MNLQQWFKSVALLGVIVTIYNFIRNLNGYGIACVLLILLLSLAIYFAIHEAEKDIEQVKCKPIQFQSIPPRKKRFVSMTINQLRSFSPGAFEEYVAYLYRQLGYHATVTPRSGDGGKDIILRDSLGEIFYVECKCYSKQSVVGRRVIQLLVGAAKGDEVVALATVTTGRFTKTAIEEAKKTGVQCIGPEQLLEMIARVDEIEKKSEKLESSELNASVSS